MRVGLHIANFTWPGGPPALARELQGRWSRHADVLRKRASNWLLCS